MLFLVIADRAILFYSSKNLTKTFIKRLEKIIYLAPALDTYEAS